MKRPIPWITSVLLFAGAVHAEPNFPPYHLNSVEPHIVPEAVLIKITPKGESLLETRIPEILSNVGLNLEQVFFPTIGYESPEPLGADSLDDKAPVVGNLLGSVQKLLGEWFSGLVINDPKLSIKIDNAFLTSSISKLTLSTNRELQAKLHINDGAVLDLNAQITRVSLGAESLMIKDLNNDFLGQVGVKNFLVALAPSTQVLTFHMPFHMKVNNEKTLQFQIYPLNSNFNEMEFALKYKELITPDLAIEINGKRYPLNKARLDEMIQKSQQQWSQQIKSGVINASEKTLPELIEKTLNEALPKNVTQKSLIPALGKPDGSHDPDLQWGLGLEDLHLNHDLTFTLNGYVEDSLNPRAPLSPGLLGRSKPALNALPASDYDLALSLDRGMINRLLQLSFERGYFKNIESDAGPLNMAEAPIMDTYPVANNSSLIKFNVPILQKISGYQRMFLKESVRVDLEIMIELRPAPQGNGYILVLKKINTSKVGFPDTNFTWLGSFLEGKIKKTVMETLNKTNAGWAKTPQPLPGILPVPPEIIGLHFKVVKLHMEPTGQIVMYMNYGD